MNLERFLTTCSNEELSTLYQSHWTVQAVLRSLPALSKQYILRLLFIDEPVPSKNVDAWIRPDFKKKHEEAIKNLTQLAILQEHRLSVNATGWALNPSFQAKLREAVCGWGNATEVVPHSVLEATPNKSQLDAYAQQQWEALLLFLVGRSRHPPELPRYMQHMKPLEVGRLLQSAGLVAEASSRGVGPVTEAGFQFLLQTSALQLWSLLDHYIRDAQAKSGLELAAVLGFLLQLGFRRVGQPCELQQLAASEQNIAAHCIQLGMLYPYQVDRVLYFSPTALASSLTEGGAQPVHLAAGHIIVETNYRVYAYTSSELQVAILQMFTRMECRLPNLFVGTLTRESIQAAMHNGITAEQVVQYLTQHAHPHVAKNAPVIPEVVSDQIRLWENDILRVRAEAAILYSDFPSEGVFAKSVTFSQSAGAYLWHDAKSQELATRAEYKQQMKEFIIKARAAETAGGPDRR